MINPACGDKPACRNHWYATRLARAPHSFEKADHKAKPTVNSKAVIERLYKNLQLDSRMLDVGNLHTILLVLSQGSRSWGVNNTSSIMEDMARCDTGKRSDKVSQRGFQQYAELHSSVIQQLDLPEVEQLSEYRHRLWLRVSSVSQDEGLQNAGRRHLDDAARLAILNRLMVVCSLGDIELDKRCIKQLWTFKRHALRSLVEYSTLMRFGFHCADPSTCIFNLRLLLNGKSINTRKSRVDQGSMSQLQPNLEYVFVSAKHQGRTRGRAAPATAPLPDVGTVPIQAVVAESR